MAIKIINRSGLTELTPAKADYHITLHPTELEKFMVCPADHDITQHNQDTASNWQSQVPDYNAQNIFIEWDITEQLMTAYQYWPRLGDTVLAYFMDSTEFPQMSRLKAHAKNWKDYINTEGAGIPTDRFPLFTQKRMTLNILTLLQWHTFCWTLVWTADRVYNDYTIADCKTASHKRGTRDHEFKLQWRLYPRMRKQLSGIPADSTTFHFTYYVFTKQVTPQLQVINLSGSYEDSERLLQSLLNEYAQCIIDNDRPAKKNLACRRCKSKPQCPLYAPVEDERF